MYFNDTWHIADRLTLNLGLRYELQNPWTERHDRLSYFNPAAPSYLNQFLPVGSTPVMGDVFLVSPESRSNVPLAKNNFGPRIGLTYGLTPKTIVRAGYGIFWIPSDVSFALNPINDMVNTPGTTYTGTVDGTHPYNTISLPFANGISPPPGRSLGTQGTQEFLTSVVQAITEVDPYHHPKGYDQQWNLSVERQLPAGFSLSAAYVGSKGTHLEQYSVQTDQISDALLGASCPPVCDRGKIGRHSVAVGAQSFSRRRNDPRSRCADHHRRAIASSLSPIHWVELAGKDRSPAPTIRFRSQRSADSPEPVRFSVAYTNSKLISNTDTLTSWLETNVGAIQDNNNLQGERSLSSQDVPQRLVVSYVLDLPFGQGKKIFCQAPGES